MLLLHLTFGITLALTLALAIFLCFGKGTILINGMMILPKEARDKINKKALGRFTSVILFTVALMVAVMWVDLAWIETEQFWLTWVAMGFMMFITVMFAILGLIKRDEWFSLSEPKNE